MIPGLPLSGIDSVWGSELGLHGELEFASTPQTQGLVDNGATVQVAVSGDIGIDTGKEVRIESGGDLRAAA